MAALAAEAVEETVRGELEKEKDARAAAEEALNEKQEACAECKDAQAKEKAALEKRITDLEKEKASLKAAPVVVVEKERTLKESLPTMTETIFVLIIALALTWLRSTKKK